VSGLAVRHLCIRRAGWVRHQPADLQRGAIPAHAL